MIATNIISVLNIWTEAHFMSKEPSYVCAFISHDIPTYFFQVISINDDAGSMSIVFSHQNGWSIFYEIWFTSSSSALNKSTAILDIARPPR